MTDDGADSQTEGEEQVRARLIRMQEVKLKPLPYLPTDTETEVSSSLLLRYGGGVHLSIHFNYPLLDKDCLYYLI